MQPSFSLTSTLGFDRLLKLRLVVADDETGVSAELPILFPPSLLPGVPEEAAKARFLASLAETQLQWLKRQAKARVDSLPEAKFLQSRYPLYKAEEEELIHEWRDRVAYGETVPHMPAEYSRNSEGPDA